MRDRTIHSLRDNDMRFYVENMTQQQLDEARHAIEENPNAITFVDRNGNTDSLKTERIDNITLKETENQTGTNIRNSSRP